ncbi:hypothetical protein CDAR_32811 [Caerostris darwini]|uniref:Uncharacterized protein n=1 Tax=Caerostris darwini TaxID=1538125 RepID=A0AAV4SNY7_9ARAC|nr:hypothetical protein CDAR_32811 [Caerostris darwini]
MGTDGESETVASQPRALSKDNEVQTQDDGDPDNAILLHKCLPLPLLTRRADSIDAQIDMFIMKLSTFPSIQKIKLARSYPSLLDLEKKIFKTSI